MRNKNRTIVIIAVLLMVVACLVMFEPWLSKQDRIERLVQEHGADLAELAEVVRDREGIEGLKYAGVKEITYRADDATVEFLCYTGSSAKGFCYAPNGAPESYPHTEPISGDWYYFEAENAA